MSSSYINRIKSGDARAFDEVYKTWKGQFIALFKKLQGLQYADAEDLYHKSCAIFLNNIETGKLNADSISDSQIKTYLNNTGKYILFNERRKRQVPLAINSDALMNLDEKAVDEEYDGEMDDKLFIIRTTVKNMPQPCAQILNLTVYQKKSHKEVARIMNYANEDTVKTQRHRCMARLREKIIERFKMSGYED